MRHLNYCNVRDSCKNHFVLSICYWCAKLIVCYCCSLGLAWVAGDGPCWDVLRWIMHFDMEQWKNICWNRQTFNNVSIHPTKQPSKIFWPWSSLNYKALDGWRFPSKVDWSPWTHPQAERRLGVWDARGHSTVFSEPIKNQNLPPDQWFF